MKKIKIHRQFVFHFRYVIKSDKYCRLFASPFWFEKMHSHTLNANKTNYYFVSIFISQFTSLLLLLCIPFTSCIHAPFNAIGVPIGPLLFWGFYHQNSSISKYLMIHQILLFILLSVISCWNFDKIKQNCKFTCSLSAPPSNRSIHYQTFKKNAR